LLLSENLHSDNSQALSLRHGESQGFEAAFARGCGLHPLRGIRHIRHPGVQCHLHAIEVVPFESCLEGHRVRMASDPDGTRDFLLTRLVKSFHDAAFCAN
jgi:hypothetical protein